MAVNLINLKVNNVVVPTTLPVVRITNGNPTVSWTFAGGSVVAVNVSNGQAGTPTEVPQHSYELRFGTSITNVGTNSFSGNLAATGVVTSSATAWRYSSGITLLRGTTYYGQVRASDAYGNTSAWMTFVLVYNSLPVANSVSIIPSTPSPGTTLSVSYSYSDADGDPEGITKIRWVCNGVYERELDDYLTVSDNYVSAGDNWLVEVAPNDGYEYGGKVFSASVIVSKPVDITPITGLQIIPNALTTADPVFAQYVYDGTRDVSIRWYVTPFEGEETAHPEADDLQLFRIALSPGDSVRFTAFIGGGTIYSSPMATVIPAPFRVFNVRIQDDIEPLSLSTLTPRITWDCIAPSGQIAQFVAIRVGTTPDGADVLDTIVPTADATFLLPTNVLAFGRDYYVDIAVSSSSDPGSFATAASSHFRTKGSLWEESVDNGVGWTIEAVVQIVTDYQGIRIADGTKYAEVQLYSSQIVLASANTAAIAVMLNDAMHAVTVVGQGSDIQVYLDHVLVIDGTVSPGSLNQATNDRYLEFGSIGNTGEAQWSAFRYTVNGPHHPGTDPAYSEFVPSTVVNIPLSQITALSGLNGGVLTAVETPDQTTDLYLYDGRRDALFAAAANRTFSSVNRIVSSPNGLYTYFCHANGATYFTSHPIVSYDSNDNMTVSLPNDWDVTLSNSGTFVPAVSSSNGLVIDTTAAGGGKWFYSMDHRGQVWFDRVDNAAGWTVDFTLKVDSITDNDGNAYTGSSDGVGLYVSDGTFYETIQFFASQIAFFNANLVIEYPATIATDYRLTCQNNLLTLYGRQFGSSMPFNMMAQATLSFLATPEGNGTKPATVIDTDGVVHAVWHDDGSNDGLSIFYSYFDGTEWSTPAVIVKPEHDGRNPSIAVDSTHVFVFYESHAMQNASVQLVVKTQFGWGDPTTIIDTGADALWPQAVVDNSGILHLVWEDYSQGVSCVSYMNRNGTTAAWSPVIQLSNSNVKAVNPAVDAAETNVAVTWTERATTGRSDIYGRSKDSSTSSTFGAIHKMSSGGYDADHSDVLISAAGAVVVWHDTQYSSSASANYNVFVVQATTLMSPAGSVIALSDNSYIAKHPRVSFIEGVNRHLVCWENTNTASLVVLNHLQSDSTWTVDGSSTCRNTVSFGTARTVRRPVAPKRFTGIPPILYETEILDDQYDDYIQNCKAFGVIRGFVQSLFVGSGGITCTSLSDVVVSAQLPRKALRWGSFSDTAKAAMRWQKIALYLSEAVQPFEIGLVSASTVAIADQRSFNALVNDDGDAWINTEGGLVFYFKGAATVARFNTGPLSGRAVQCICIDDAGVLYVSSDGTIYSSVDHVVFALMTLTGAPDGVAINDMMVSNSTTLLLATTGGVLSLNTATSVVTPLLTTTNGLPNANVNCLAQDELTLWVGTDAGLVSYAGNAVTVFDTSNSAILDAKVNDIAIRSSGQRYVATAAGLCQMNGSTFSRLSTNDDAIWNNNTKAVAFLSPNTLWVSTLSNVCQIQLDDLTNDNTSVVYNVGNYALGATAYDDLRTFYVLGNPVPDPKAFVEVYVNGGRVAGGFVLSTDKTIIQFESPLLTSDIVYVIYRQDFTSYSTFRQNITELEAIGKQSRLVDDLLVLGTDIYAKVVVDGTPFLYQSDTTTNLLLPYDRIFLDQTPPAGTIKILGQTGPLTVKVAIEGASDTGSGLDTMIISNYPNFTTDGTTPQTPVPFADTALQQLSNSLATGVIVQSLGTNTGTVFGYYNNILFAGTQTQACVYRLNTDGSWSNSVTINGIPKTTFDALGSVDFLVAYGSQFYVGIGKNGGTTTRIYSTTDGIAWNIIGSVGAAHVPCATVFNNSLYLGGSNGNVYQFDGTTFYAPVASGLASCDCMVGYLSTLFVGGSATVGGQIVAININSQTPQIIFTTTDPAVSSLNVFNTSSVSYIYAGVNSSGKIYRRNVTGGVFTATFIDIPGDVSSIRQGVSAISASIGATIYTQGVTSTGGLQSWQVEAKFPGETIRDFFFLPVTTISSSSSTTTTTYQLYVLSQAGIYQVPNSTASLNVYLKLFDGAGNSSANEPIFDSITISTLNGFVNVNQIIELNPTNGLPVNTYNGSAPFWSVDRVESETGEYWSEIFYGTNNLIAWDQLSWNGAATTGTDINLYVRASNTRDEVLSQPWSVAFPNNLQSGVNISFLQGVYIQFKAVLSTTIPNLSPSLSQVVIRSQTSQSVHFYTTNFILGQPITRGLLTASAIIPIAADVIWGISTTNSTEFDEYQVIQPDQIFIADETQTGTGLRVGIKFISPTTPTLVTDTFGSSGPGGSPLFVNRVTNSFVLTSTGDYSFTVTFYNNSAMMDSDVVFTADSNVDSTGFVINSSNISTGTVTLNASTITFGYTPPSDSGLVCSPQANPTYYWVRIEVFENSTVVSGLTDSSHTFVAGCNPQFFNNISFAFTPGASSTYAFQVQMYDKTDRTDTVVESYYTGIPWPADSTGNWQINGGAYTNATISVSGESLVSGTPYTVTLHPPAEQFTVGTEYYLTIQSYNSSTGRFTMLDDSSVFEISDPVSDVTCGPYTNVPVVKGFAITFTLADGSLVTINN